MAIVTQIQNHQASATVHIGATAFLGVALDSAASQGGLGSGGFGGQSGSSSSGATVAQVLSGTPAAQAGLTAGDVIVSVDGQTVDSPTTLSTLLEQPPPGRQASRSAGPTPRAPSTRAPCSSPRDRPPENGRPTTASVAQTTAPRRTMRRGAVSLFDRPPATAA